MWKCLALLFLFSLSSCMLMPCTINMKVNNNYVDEFQTLDRIWNNADSGTILENTNIVPDYIEKVFENNIGNKIFYKGPEYRGYGIFEVENNLGLKTAILETNIRYGAKIIWHGEHIAEIPIPTGSPFTHSYYYDFNDNTISRAYNFPLYCDTDNNFVLVWGNQDFELYNIKTNVLLKVYDHRRDAGLTPDWPFIKWYIKKEDETTIIMYWEHSDDNRTGEFIIVI